MIFQSENLLTLAGQVASSPVFSHESHNERFVSFNLRIERLSKACDIIKVIVHEEKIHALQPAIGDFVELAGELRSFNNKSGIGSRLIVTAYVRTISTCEAVFKNELTISGIICKKPVYRKTPLGREICDIMLAINRRYGRADYLPCIVWGKNAFSASDLRIGCPVTILGRVQSREYVKTIDAAQETRVTYEVSVSKIEPIELP
ncbi:MAG: single-stranded DNA-binding protein [Clostridia bacterium]